MAIGKICPPAVTATAKVARSGLEDKDLRLEDRL
jgi:hypothetical protein